MSVPDRRVASPAAYSTIESVAFGSLRMLATQSTPLTVDDSGELHKIAENPSSCEGDLLANESPCAYCGLCCRAGDLRARSQGAWDVTSVARFA